MPNAYDQLMSRARDLAILESVAGLVGYDERTFMPTRAANWRAEQNSYLARLLHERATDPQIGTLLKEATDEVKSLAADSEQRANVREMQREYDRAVKLPGDFVAEMSRTTSLAEHAWADARKDNSFAKFQPWLEKIVSLKRREAGYIGTTTGNPYDALLDAYEPGEVSANVARVFDALRPRLVELLGKVVGSTRKAPIEIFERTYPKAQQQQFARIAAEAVGFDLSAGRIDESVHPFCSGMAPGDTRMTTRYDENSFGDAFFGTLHETGHALYEQGLPKETHAGQPIASSISLGIHESQSRMWENIVGRSRAFWQHMLPKAKDVFGKTIADVTLDQWHFAANHVQPSFIRVEADEFTYNLHIMLRFELEQALIGGQLEAADVPSAWNERFKKQIGLDVPSDAMGCLQDVHWSAGLFGYFATYALGNLYAAQFYEQARKDLGDLDAMFARGEFAPLLGWLRSNIHGHGKRYRAADLVQRVTGRPLSADPLMSYLSSKASALYGV